MLEEVCAEFELGGIVEFSPVPEGLMNRNWRVVTQAGEFAVKQLLDVDAGRAREQHAVVRSLAARGLPVASARHGGDGQTVLTRGTATFTVQPWAPGRHRSGAQLDLAECRRLGEVLGDLHGALAELSTPVGPSSAHPVRPAEEARTLLAGYADLIASLHRPDDFDVVALAHLRWRLRILDESGHLCPDGAEPELGWTHGDFHHFNVLWDGSEISAVLDWDRLGLRPVADELARAAVLIFGDGPALDLPRITAFVAGYRSMRPLTGEQVADALHRLWWHWLAGDWPLNTRYHHADTSCDHLFLVNSARLQWWTPRREQVLAAFTA
ncbi:homoserine kinase type II [Allocatelliglobosispora scoriae]|uniref:Homoserine kinase type II n=1 Tax=Allocatelliglobosispora scoriae TaxID=643052 RepID=A0A841BJI0_9ACTN|nr:phosphotransferase [Allocatelliglobosispora scoriae]MBB5869267.1 homoserine kinase type II [Allocatelliglobosispora scoriae]